MKNIVSTEQLSQTENLGATIRKDHHIKGRKYNGYPHLKLKTVKVSPRKKIRRILREAIALNNIN